MYNSNDIIIIRSGNNILMWITLIRLSPFHHMLRMFFMRHTMTLGPDLKDVRDFGARSRGTLGTLGPDLKHFRDFGARS